MHFRPTIAIIISLLMSSLVLGQNQGGEDCVDAIDIGVIGDLESCPGGAGFMNENTSIALPAGKLSSCDKIGMNNDIWYKFTTPTCGSIQFHINLGTASRIEAAIYEHCDSSDIACNSSHSDQWIVDSLVPGKMYFIQLWSDDFAAGTFDFCVTCAPEPPTNDSCHLATNLVVTPMDPCNPTMMGSTYNNFGTTPSGEMPSPSCGTFGLGADIWFSVTVPPSGNLNLEMTSARGPQDWAMALYSGSCGSLAEAACDDDSGNGLLPKIELTGLMAGSVYYLRVWEFGGDHYGYFTLRSTEPLSSPPSNDDCANAVDITATVLLNTCVSSTCGHNFNATPSTGVPNPTCSQLGVGNDVWYKVIVPSNGNVTVEMSAHSGIGPQDWAMQAYTGTCGSLALLECDDDDGPGLYPLIDLQGRTPGEEIFFRVWEYNSDEEGSFEICNYSSIVLASSFDKLIGEHDPEGNKLQWSAYNDHSIEQYLIERKTNNGIWTKIASTPSQKQDETKYQFIDEEAVSNAYYRLKMMSTDGSSMYSNTIFIGERIEEQIQIFPNPADEVLYIDLGTMIIKSSQASVNVFTLNGKLVKSYPITTNGKIGIPTGDLKSGMYILEFDHKDVMKTMKFVKQ